MKTALKVALLALGLTVVAAPAMARGAPNPGPVATVVRALTHPVATALRAPARVATSPVRHGRYVVPVRAAAPVRHFVPRLFDPTPGTPGIFR